MYLRKIIGGFLLVVIASLLVSCGGADERKQKYFEKAQGYIEEGNLDKAKIELKNVLQIDPKFSEAYYLIGDIEEKNKNWRKAFASYAKAIELDPANVIAASKMAKFYVLQGNLPKAREMADLALKNEPSSPEAKLANAIVLVREGHVSDAKNVVRGMIEKDPKDIEPYDFLSSLLVSEKKIEEAEKILEAGIKNNNKDIHLRLKLAKLSFDKDKKKTEDLIKEIIKIKPDDFMSYVLLSSVFVADNQPDKAENVLRDLIKNNPENPKSYLVLADFLSKIRGALIAENELKNMISLGNAMPELKFALAKVYLAQGKSNDTELLYEELIDQYRTDPSGLKARNELAILYLKSNDIEKASSLIEEILEVNVNDYAALMAKAEIAIQKKNPEVAIAALRTVMKEQPDSMEAAALMAKAHYMNNEKTLAKEALLNAVGNNPKNINAHMALAQFYMLTGDVENALLKLEDTLFLDKSNKGALVLKTEIAMKKQDYENAANVIQQLILSYPEDSLGYYVSGQYHLVRNEYKQAEAQFKKSLRFNKNAEKSLSGLVKALLSQTKHSAALNYLHERLVEYPDNAFLFNLVGETYTSNKKYDEAEKNYLLAIKNSKKWSLPYGNLANLYMYKKEYQKAISYLNTAISYNEKNDKLLLLLASIHEQQGQYKKAKEQYEKILAFSPNHLLAINNLSSLLADRFDDPALLDQALELAEKLAKTNNAAYIDTLGWVYYKIGRLEEAEKLLKQVVRVAPQYAIFRYHLGMVYFKMGQKKEAQTHLEKALEKDENFTGKENAMKTLNVLKQ